MGGASGDYSLHREIKSETGPQILPNHGTWIEEYLTPIRCIYVFVFINFVNFVDRGIIPGAPNQFLDLIEEDTHSDKESTLLGLTQSVFLFTYSISMPVSAYLVNRMPPFRLLSYALFIWIAAVFISGLASPVRSFGVLLTGRALSGVGEAALQCVAPAFIDDYAPANRKASLLGIFSSAIVVGYAFGYIYSAFVSSSAIGWMGAYWIEGIIMLPIAFAFLKVPYVLLNTQTDRLSKKNTSGDVMAIDSAALEPMDDTENRNRGEGGSVSSTSTFKERVIVLLKNPMLMLIAGGYAAEVAVMSGLSTFGPTLVVGLGVINNEKTASIVFGSIVCVTGGFATTLGGYLADHFKADETPLALRKTCLTIMSVSTLFGFLVAITVCWITNSGLFIAMLALQTSLLFLPISCITAATLISVKDKVLRPLAIAVQTFIIHAIGDVPSPIIVGAIKDSLAPNCGVKEGSSGLNPDCPKDRMGLRFTLFYMSLWMFWSVLLWFIALWFHKRHKPGESRLKSTKMSVSEQYVLGDGGIEDSNFFDRESKDGQQQTVGL